MNGPRPMLRVGDAVALVVGTVVGAGIFRTPPFVAANTGSEATALLAWTLGGVVSLVGALCYAELTTAYPSAGGDYHFLTRAFGRRLGFLFAWARLSVIQTGSIALLAFVIGDYMAALLPRGVGAPALWAAGAIAVLTSLNVLGLRQGKFAQNVLTTAQVFGVLLLVIVGVALFLRGAPPAAASTTPAAAPAFGLSMVFVLLTYGGWNEAAYISAEVRDGRRNMVRALVTSIFIVTALYVLVNWAYLQGLGLDGVAGSNAVAADLVERALGPGGGRFAAFLIVVSALTSINATILTGARSAYAVGRDVPALAFLGRWHATAGTPVTALVVQGVAALALVLVGTLTRKGFETMVEYTAPVFWLFFLLIGVSLFVLRSRPPDTPRPFRVPLYPLTPLVFCVTSAYLLYSSLMYTGTGALVGVGVLAFGAVLLALMPGAPREQGGLS
jgi:basic amino acid/polyamine antiporter, APA family